MRSGAWGTTSARYRPTEALVLMTVRTTSGSAVSAQIHALAAITAPNLTDR